VDSSNSSESGISSEDNDQSDGSEITVTHLGHNIGPTKCTSNRDVQTPSALSVEIINGTDLKIQSSANIREARRSDI
jgi:hypothetical protein